MAGADGAWRLYVFADLAHPRASDSRFRALAEFLASADSPITRFTPAGFAPDAVIDVRSVLQQDHRDVSVADMPSVLLPRKGPFGLFDCEKTFCPDPASDIFDRRGLDRENGAVVVVRPGQYVAHVLPLDAHDELVDFLHGSLVEVATSHDAVGR